MAIERVLVVGSGGREHALAWRLARDPATPVVRVAPGNDGIAREFECLPVDALDAEGLAAACRRLAIDLVVIGPEAPLAAGLADQLQAAGVRVFGPGREAARIESSKWFAKERMIEAGIPTARAESFTEASPALAALSRFAPPWVIKADGLAAGKGVRVTDDRAAAASFVRECLAGERHGDSGRRIVIEEFLAGEEASLMAVCDGERHVLLPAARDYKRAYDGDHGPNTGGMGAYAPAAGVDERVERDVSERIVTPLLRAMAARGTPYRGLLYVGLMLGAAGPRVVEFNARFGDPEAEVVLPLVGGALAETLARAADGHLDAGELPRATGAAVAVALVDEDYPGHSRGGGRLMGLERAEHAEQTLVFHAATQRDGEAWRVAGGRAVFVVGRGATVGEARERAYAAVDQVEGSGWRCRRDIAAQFAAEPANGSAPA